MFPAPEIHSALCTYLLCLGGVAQKVLAAALSLAGGDLDTACSMLFEDGDTLAAQVEPVPTPSQESGNLDTDRKRMAFLQRIQAHVDQVMTYELQSMLVRES